jgi:hypothetical protein
MTIVQGLAAGVDFRADDQSNLYAYTVDVTGDYLLEMTYPANHHQYAILASGESSWLKLGNGQPNTLGVSARGSTLSIYANGHLLKTVHDSTHPEGWVGVVVGSYKNHFANKDVLTIARYTDAKIWVLP